MRYGARVVGVEEHPERVEVELERRLPVGRRPARRGRRGALADPRRIIDPAAPDGRYVGLTNFGGHHPATPRWPPSWPAEAWHLVFGRRAFFGAHRDTRRRRGLVRQRPAGADRTPTNGPRTSTAQWQAVAGRAARRTTPGPAAALVAAGELELAGDSTYDLGHVPVWHRGRLLVIGDAAHAPSPSSGQGASMALEDAVELARCLRDLPGGRGGVRGVRRRSGAPGSRGSWPPGPGAAAARRRDPVGRMVRDAVLRLVFRYVVTDGRSPG